MPFARSASLIKPELPTLGDSIDRRRTEFLRRSKSSTVLDGTRRIRRRRGP
jgi:hypothetical protein